MFPGIFGLRFDLPEFFVGLAAGVTLSFVVLRFRPLVRWAVRFGGDSAQRLSERFTAGAQDHYQQELIERAETYHAAGMILALSEIAEAPRVLAPPPATDPAQPDPPPQDTLSVLPNLPDWDYLSGIYQAHSLTLEDAVAQGTPMLITGGLGCGKSTALAYLALRVAEGSASLGVSRTLLPVLIHAGDLEFSPASESKPFDPLVSAVQRRASAGLSPRIPSYLRQHLQEKRALVLVDGLDELGASEIEQVTGWLVQLMQEFPDNRWVAAGPFRGYDGLVSAGFAPVALAPWSDLQRRAFLNRWGAAWQEHVTPLLPASKLEEIDPALVTGWLLEETRGLSPLELTLRAWAAHAGDVRGGEIHQQFQAFVGRFLSPEEQQAAVSVAQTWIEGRQGAIEEAKLPPDTPTPDLVNSGVVVRRSGSRLSFSMPAVAAYLAGRGMLEGKLPKNIDRDDWLPAQTALGFYAALSKAATLPEERLKASQAPLERGILTAGRWLRLAPQGAAWRANALRSLAKLIQDPARPYGLRLRATHAMAQSQESGAGVFFRRLLTSPTISNRILGSLGLGGLSEQEDVAGLQRILTEDPDLRVRHAACLALAAIGSEAAMEALGQALLHGEEPVRVAAAEALAINPGEGHAMLKDAMTIEDLLTRRAAVFGLARIPETWAGDLLEKTQLEDDEWVVRGAAAEALEKKRNPPWRISPPPTEPSELPWLVAFAAREGLGVAPGKAALEMLRKALQKGTPDEKVAALETIGWLGSGELSLEIKQALSEGEPYLKDAAYEALWRQAAAGAIPVVMTEQAAD